MSGHGAAERPTVDTVRAMGARYTNWGRWGSDDQAGTLNYITADKIVAASRLVRRGKSFSLAIPLDANGPQTGARINPLHFMVRDGADVAAGVALRDFYKKELYIRSTDDLIIMHCHGSTHWDALAHIIFENQLYNGYPAHQVSSKGAMKNDISGVSDRILGRGVLLDLPRAKGAEWLPPGTAITGDDLQDCADQQGVKIQSGDIVLVRTGAMRAVRERGSWGDYAGGTAPGLGLGAVPWLFERQIAAVATDTWGAEVIPSETNDVYLPLHILLIVFMGMTVGEIFDLEELARDCADDRCYEFLFSAAPLRITGGVGSPINPVAVK